MLQTYECVNVFGCAVTGACILVIAVTQLEFVF